MKFHEFILQAKSPTTCHPTPSPSLLTGTLRTTPPPAWPHQQTGATFTLPWQQTCQLVAHTQFFPHIFLFLFSAFLSHLKLFAVIAGGRKKHKSSRCRDRERWRVVGSGARKSAREKCVKQGKQRGQDKTTQINGVSRLHHASCRSPSAPSLYANCCATSKIKMRKKTFSLHFRIKESRDATTLKMRGKKQQQQQKNDNK